MTVDKKGTIVISTPRSGSHMACSMLYNTSSIPNKVYLGEIYNLPYAQGKYVYGSMVQLPIKTLLAADLSWTSEYHVVNLRRRDKVAQYISWCVFRAQLSSSVYNHSPKWEDCATMLPWNSTQGDIENFIQDQLMDFAFLPDDIVYYEDMIVSGIHTEFKKMHYPIPPEEIVTDYQLVKSMLKRFSYDRR